MNIHKNIALKYKEYILKSKCDRGGEEMEEHKGTNYYPRRVSCRRRLMYIELNNRRRGSGFIPSKMYKPGPYSYSVVVVSMPSPGTPSSIVTDFTTHDE
jgi:hypothetical protein